MANEELKKKIIDVLRDNIEYEANTHSDDNYTEVVIKYEALADALIAAEIGDVSELQKECDSKEEAYNKCYFDFKHWKDKAKEYKHRAEVAEKALNSACFILAKNYYTEGKEDWAKRGAECATFYREQAEKELAKEKKDEQN